ncbi:MAG: hypothetical protein JW870_16830 [Candidatus Delongbacteria bacterium]|nr:hypothetical protein [Candidatus Delongbacteria bacterium]
MISRKTALKLGEVFETIFTYTGQGMYGTRSFKIKKDSLYDFLFTNDYEPWFCNSIKKIYEKSRNLKEHIAKLHTGETLAEATPGLSWENRKQLGQKYLSELIIDILDYSYSNKYDYSTHKVEEFVKELINLIELDGYKYKKGLLLPPEEDVIDIDTERGYLQELISDAGLKNQETILHHLNLSEEHYINSKWDDSVSNSRKFFEEIVRQVANKLSFLKVGKDLDDKILEKGGSCINYIKKEGLIEEKEDKALGELYVLMSSEGGHPYMAQKDQARFLRNLSLTTSQFILLRLIGFINEK